MEKWSLNDYFDGLRAKGYDVKTRTDEAGILRGYVLRKGNSKFKASEIGKGRNLMASKLEGTWKNFITPQNSIHAMIITITTILFTDPEHTARRLSMTECHTPGLFPNR